MQTAKHDLMRSTNTLSILECIRQSGPTTKREIQDKTGLSWGAISNITTDLFNKRVISEFNPTFGKMSKKTTKIATF